MAHFWNVGVNVQGRKEDDGDGTGEVETGIGMMQCVSCNGSGKGY